MFAAGYRIIVAEVIRQKRTTIHYKSHFVKEVGLRMFIRIQPIASAVITGPLSDDGLVRRRRVERGGNG